MHPSPTKNADVAGNLLLYLYLIIKEEAFPWFGPFWFV
jgi:hypothetical protein